MHGERNEIEKLEEARIIAPIVIRPDDDTQTYLWTKMINEMRKKDGELQRKKKLFPNYLYDRDEITRTITTREERIIIPDKASWIILRKIHEFILHFGTDKVIDFAK